MRTIILAILFFSCSNPEERSKTENLPPTAEELKFAMSEEPNIALLCSETLDGTEFCTTLDSIPYSGLYEVRYSNHKLKLTQEYQDGLKNGIYMSYNPDGQLREKGGFLSNLKHGDWFSYDNNIVVHKRTYRSGKLNGIEKRYDDRGEETGSTQYKDGEFQSGYLVNHVGEKEEIDTTLQNDEYVISRTYTIEDEKKTANNE